MAACGLRADRLHIERMVAMLLGPTVFAAVFDPERLLQVCAALSLNRAPRGATANGAFR
jgi:hypothetical protein